MTRDVLMDITTIASMLTERQQQCIVDLDGEWKSHGYCRVSADLIWATDNFLFPDRFPPLVECCYYQPQGQYSRQRHRLLPLGLDVKRYLETHRGLTPTRSQMAMDKPSSLSPKRMNKRPTLVPTTETLSESLETFQARVTALISTVFGRASLDNCRIRDRKFYEEATELMQAGTVSREDAHAIVDHVYNQEPGEISQEVGGVLISLAALCTSRQINLFGSGLTELTRIGNNVETIRIKEAAKETFSA